MNEPSGTQQAGRDRASGECVKERGGYVEWLCGRPSRDEMAEPPCRIRLTFAKLGICRILSYTPKAFKISSRDLLDCLKAISGGLDAEMLYYTSALTIYLSW